jgi:predicted outer membrane repeat protein
LPTAESPLFTSAFLAFCSTSLANELLVPSQYLTIQSAIDAAIDGDTVIVAPGTYTGIGNRDIDFKGKTITVQSTEPNNPNIIAATIIDCNGTEAEPHRGFYFHSSENTTSVLNGLTIINGYAPNAPYQADSRTYNYWAGGAIFCYQSSPTISNCCLINNSADWFGGAISGWESDSLITGCTITNNVANGGGGANCRDGTMIISNCVITNNRAKGGAIGIGANVGGGINCESSAGAIINNCIITGNIASVGGGIFAGGYCWPVITNCTFSGNTATTAGGAIYCGELSNPSVVNSALWGNGAINGAEIAMGTIDWGSSLSISYSNIRGGKAGVAGGGSSRTRLNWGKGNIDADPCFVQPGYWDANGVWVEGDYHLKSEGWRWDIKRNRWTYDDVTSRCIDAGNPGSPLGDELLSVPDDPNNIWGQNLRIDMGAFGGTAEASIPPYDWAILADLTNDGKVDLNDLVAFVNYWLDSGECIPSDLNRNQFVDLFDFALLVEDWLGQTTWH